MRRMRAGFLRLYRFPSLLLCLAAAGWSGNFVVGRLIQGSVPPVNLAFFRWLTATLVLLPFGLPRLRRDLPALAERKWTVLLLALTGVAAYNTFVYQGLRTSTAISALLMQSVMPLLILVFVFALYRERPRAAQLLGLALSLAGVWVVVTEGRPLNAGAFDLNVGHAWILLAVVGYALYTALLRRRPRVHPLSLLTVTFGLGALMLAPFAFAETASGRSLPLTAGSIAAVAYVALIPSLLCYFCYNRGAELLGAARAGQFLHLMPVFGAVLAFFFLGERIRGFHLAGAALIGAGLAAAALRGRAAARSEA
ncbi:DMT family transporter [Phytomonospora endophytica]|uniref:Drug/metabolite transporter (DMT)-like permease n=1 Tax=Phytomonospora endophytica TaxID=714109 RepID=A0A841FXB1_9ACTN|nr:DMT family transporter [Phytomonospora endophytica]MBB6037987.1 drug/metabolite transporter (DMT)-like permease [Phytomonospora endophytica]GIG68886.1 multidrug DMT transporter permease [Phytomonospora endophytica]